MDLEKTFTAGRDRKPPRLLLYCLLLSVLLHLILYVLLYEKLTDTATIQQRYQPTVVRLVDRPSTQEQYELDQRPQQPSEQVPETSRMAEQNQQVEREMAPKGEDSRDRAARPAQPAPATGATSGQPQVAAPPPKQQPAPTATERPATRPDQQQTTTQQPRGELPSLEQLTQLPQDTLGRISSSEAARRESIKERDDLETGDTVWLNLQRGQLISFFRRFHDQVEGLWNYPREAAEKGQEGELLLKILVDRDGELLDVELLRSSGYDILDFEAIQAVYRAAPFGPLGKHYPHPDLKIMAHFRYTITGRYIYGRRQ